ncbi:pilus assembly protein TadG-related protein [Hyalangium sp.]|uniref:pilus assembly protein TadG-related protein n=1 Tax=Hyalangium sp. TaxID=2028555 RepID=UPI002D74E019|nr:hypothetical protein [Hyalangium sp.]HYH94534.1 hypothetical protein [Hyalangium sp.]
MNFTLALRRATVPGRSRGQMIILAAVSLLVLALVVLITFNVTVAVQQRIKLQNYADTKAFSMAVAEARTLNYLAYTNRAIASSYVGMANVHAYMSEAAMLADLKLASFMIMEEIVGQEIEKCECCLGMPCCFNHCIDAAFAEVNAIGLFIDWISGDVKGSLSAIDGPAADTVSALDTHIQNIRQSQVDSKAAVETMLGNGTFGALKQNNMQLAASVTSDEDAVKAANMDQWRGAFDDRDDIKKQIMSEVANASRHHFAWNRYGGITSPVTPPTMDLFPDLSERVKSSTIWIGEEGDWTISQIPEAMVTAGGRTGFRDSGFTMGLTGDVDTGANAQVVTSFDWGTLRGEWMHGNGSLPLPLTAMLFPGRITTGQSNEHSGGFTGDIFNNPHSGDHTVEMDMSRFEEFRISTSFPFNQPSVFAAVSTDTRVNEYGQRGPWEVAKDGSGTVTVKNVGPQDAKISLANNTRSRAISKAMVYYHRIGDWSDYPNMFNPFWRAKLHPLSEDEMNTVLGGLDGNAVQVVNGASGVSSGAVNVK